MQIANEIRDYIRTQLATDVPDIGLDSNLWTDGYLDSTAILELVLWLESTFEVTVENEDLTPENFATIRNIEEFVQRALAASPDSRSVSPRS
jgi:methoxymalonate biosynthesis acyl carrier protein